MTEEHACKWCKKSFSSERTLFAHMCPKKRRWADKELTHVRLGFRVFQMFYEMSTNASKAKTHEEFIESKYYESFVKFGRACVRNEYLEPERFAEWLIREGKKLADWPKDKTYDEYLLDYARRETGLRAMERTIRHMCTWAEETNNPWHDYFKKATGPRAVFDIRAAKVSPWVIYLSEGGPEMIETFSAEQTELTKHILDVNFWMKLFAMNKEEMKLVKEACDAAGL